MLSRRWFHTFYYAAMGFVVFALCWSLAVPSRVSASDVTPIIGGECCYGCTDASDCTQKEGADEDCTQTWKSAATNPDGNGTVRPQNYCTKPQCEFKASTNCVITSH
jgi:hypothetical protein